MTRLLALLLLLPTAALAIDLGDLNLPTERVHSSGTTSRWRTPPTIPDTSAWTVTTVTGCDLADNANSDVSCVTTAVSAANADAPNAIIYFPAGTYNFTTNYSVSLSNSNMVLRCEDPATTTLKWSADTGTCGSKASFAGVCGASAQTLTTTWTGGFTDGATVLTVASTTGYVAGDWIIAWMPEEANCFDGLVPNDALSYAHQAKIVTVDSGTQLTIDRGLRFNYNEDADCTAARSVAKVAGMIENVGVENCTFAHADPTNAAYGFNALVEVYQAANAWVTGSVIKDEYNRGVSVGNSTGVLIQGNRFENIGNSVVSDSGSMDIEQVSSDVVVVNNVFKDNHVGAYLREGAEGTVFAYNYFTTLVDCERSFLSHGSYSRVSLIEGNDVDCPIQLDTFFGRQGPNNMIYRNRHRFKVGGTRASSTWSPSFHRDGTYPLIADRTSVVANAGLWFMSGAPWATTPSSTAVYDMDSESTNMWIELNVASDRFGLTTAEATTDCGDGTGSAGCAAAGQYNGRNYFHSVTTYPPASPVPAPIAWAAVQIPDSMFLTEAPSWWCQEACPWAAESGIGALGDDLGGALCKLPAQIRYEAGTCTALAAEAPATHSMGGGSMSGGSWGGP